MPLFLFAKQIVDMFYSFAILDYLILGMLIVMLAYQLILVHSSPKNLALPDYLVLVLAGVAIFGFFQNPDAYRPMFKVLSAYLIYFVGRVYRERIGECHGAVVFSSYLVIWLNVAHRIIRTGGLFQGMDNSGEFYYFKTDLSYAALLGAAFIVIWGRDRWLKWLTVLFAVPYLCLYSLSRSGWVMLLPLYFLLALFLLEKRRGVPIRLNIRILGAAGGILLITGIGFTLIYSYALTGSFLPNPAAILQHAAEHRGILHARGEVWPAMWEDLNAAPLWQRLFGKGWGADSLFLSGFVASEAHSLYFLLFYCNGYIGLLCFIAFEGVILFSLRRVKDRGLFYLVLATHFLLLGYGISYSAIASTQMSWFPFMLAGMTVSDSVSQSEKGKEQISA